jgi:hypothetical protein
MAYIDPPKTPLPRYKGTVVCPGCWAEFTPGIWVRGFYGGDAHSTENQPFIKTSTVPAGKCPHCLTDLSKI